VEGSPRRIIVPSLRGTLFAEPRQVVRIEVAPGSPRPIVRIENHTPAPPGAGRQKWDETRFADALAAAKLPPPLKELADFLLALVDGEDIVASYGTGQTGSLTLKRHNKGVIEFYLDGRIGFRISGFEDALGPVAGQRYRVAIAELFGRGTLWGPSIPADKAAKRAPQLMALLRQAVEEARRA
jgi:hypothetical protein